ncbi:hypothetical protein FE634_13320 [Nocardioides dongxiaopingii]|uniref:hypothetical protein n=1 Tax=Nocardioides TaxID=1839 RepID=UPI0010C761F4|nr:MULTISPECIES: hypothetical protein [Nocardioides]QCW51138.1 hypothetical protein FE634_13320 [Nocardioides sp. S-1144]
MKKSIAALSATALLAGPAAVALTAAPAHADVERQGVCGTGTYELSVDREGRGHEVNVDLDNLPAGSAWRVKLWQDGKRVANVVRTAERDGDLDLERYRPNTAGADTFKFTAKRVGATTRCGASVTV